MITLIVILLFTLFFFIFVLNGKSLVIKNHCKAVVANNLRKFNVCILEAGHYGLHMTADGTKFWG